MKKYTSYIIGAISVALLSLPLEASVISDQSVSTVNPAVLCSEATPTETTIQAKSDLPECELAMDTDDAILAGIMGAAVIGAAIIANNDHHHRETVIVEQAPPPPPRTQTIVVHDNTPQYGPGPHHRPHHAVAHHSEHHPNPRMHGDRHDYSGYDRGRGSHQTKHSDHKNRRR
ncbi:hypothetical protein IJT17_09705 [bacterium]|nr:hypothetical protein [bacterium]